MAQSSRFRPREHPALTRAVLNGQLVGPLVSRNFTHECKTLRGQLAEGGRRGSRGAQGRRDQDQQQQPADGYSTSAW